MIVIKAITIGLFLFASESLANICAGRWNGDQIPNPTDCSSFYVCSYGEPKMFKCLNNLLYDPTKRVCNWAYLVNCGETAGSQGHVPILPNPPYYPDPQQPQIEWEQHGVPEYETQPPQYYTQPPQYNTEPSQYYTQPTQYQTQQPPQYSTSLPPYTAHPPPIVDVPSVPNYSEADEFFPGLVESHPNVFHCTNPEFYFAPHPRNCERYFICENYRIHDQQCGEGINWDYVYNQCDFPTKSFCYSGVSITDYFPIIEESTVAPEKGNLIECPGSQVFIGDPGDCRKYYICIGGIPIATSCPDRMAWDKDMTQCNEEAWQHCFD